MLDRTAPSLPTPGGFVAPDADFERARAAFLQGPAASGAGLIFTISIVLFILLGSGNSGGLSGILSMGGVLLLHEFGHLLGMRLFGYRDLRILFIPFLGAMTSGRKTGAPLWQQGVVALLGPLPGIVIGLALALVNVVTPHPLLASATSSFVAVNAFNLMPIAPLDGGFLFQAALFCRSKTAETVFHAVAVFASLALSFYLGSWALGLVAVVMLIGFPHQMKVMRAGHELRAGAPLPTDPLLLTPEQQRLLFEKARAIVPASAQAKHWPQLMRTLHDRALWRPPAMGASLGLIAAWGAGVAAALVGTILLAVSHVLHR